MTNIDTSIIPVIMLILAVVAKPDSQFSRYFPKTKSLGRKRLDAPRNIKIMFLWVITFSSVISIFQFRGYKIFE